MKSFYLSLVCCLILTACGSEKASTTLGTGHESEHKPSLSVKLDVAGNQATVKVKTDMSISAEHYGEARKPGEGHIHMYLGNGDKIPATQGEQVFNDLPAGHHTLKVSLHN